MALTYDGSFASIEFVELYESGLSPAEPDEIEEYTDLHHANSDDHTVQLGGAGLRLIDLPIATSSANKTALKAQRGNSGTLVYHAGSVTGRLVGITGIRKIKQHTDYKLTLKLII